VQEWKDSLTLPPTPLVDDLTLFGESSLGTLTLVTLHESSPSTLGTFNFSSLGSLILIFYPPLPHDPIDPAPTLPTLSILHDLIGDPMGDPIGEQLQGSSPTGD